MHYFAEMLKGHVLNGSHNLMISYYWDVSRARKSVSWILKFIDALILNINISPVIWEQFRGQITCTGAGYVRVSQIYTSDENGPINYNMCVYTTAKLTDAVYFWWYTLNIPPIANSFQSTLMHIFIRHMQCGRSTQHRERVLCHCFHMILALYPAFPCLEQVSYAW